MIEALRETNAFRWDRIDEYLERLGSGAVRKRLGFLVEQMDLQVLDRNERLSRWQEQLTQGLAVLDPSSPRRPHRIDTRWRIQVNVEEEVLTRGEL